jgi:PAS domain S-box-containing protein
MHFKAGRRAFKVVLIYIIVAGGWIVFAAELVKALVRHPEERLHVFIFAGVALVLLTGIVLHVGRRRILLRWEEETEQRKRAEAAHQEAETALAQSRSLLNATLESTADGILVVDAQGKVASFNRKFLELWKIPLTVAASHGDRQLIEFVMDQLAEPAAFVAKVEELYKNPQVSSFDELKFRDGRILERFSQPQRIGNDVLGRVWSFRDVTEHKHAFEAMRESEQCYRQLFELESDAVVLVDCETHRFVDVNYSAQQVYGYDRKEFLQLKAEDVSDEPEKTQEVIGSGSFCIPLRWHRKKNGQRFAVEITANRIKHKGRWTELATIRDITIRQQTMELLQDSTRQLLAAQRLARLGSYSYDVKADHWTSSVVLDEMFGIGASSVSRYKKDLAGWLQIVHPEERAEMRRYLDEEVLKGRAEFDRNYRIVRQDDQAVRWVHGLGKLFLDDQGQVAQMVGIIQDITERKQAEAALREGEERYNALFDRSLDCVFLSDFEGRFLDANRAALDLLGYRREEISSVSLASLLTEDQLPAAFRAIEDIKATGRQLRPSVIKVRAKDGRQVLMETQSSLIYREGKPYAIQGIARDITERKRAEEAHARLAIAVEQAAESIVITDTNGTILYANPAFEQTSGYTFAEVVGKKPGILKSGRHEAEFYRRMWEVLQSGNIWRGHFINRHKNGAIYEEEATISPVRDATGKVVNYVAAKRDVTREVQLEAQFRQSQKMEAIGQLAGGVAHDFNNILAVIQLQAGLLKVEEGLTEQQLEYADDIEKAAQRASNLVRQLLLFGRKQALRLGDVELNEAVNGIAKMLHRILGEQIQIQFKLAAQPLLVHADTSMLDQLLINLAVNARDAMPKSGRLIVTTSAVELDAEATAQTAPARPGSFACISVTDTGCGIRPEILPRIFEPFFTTKDVGKGSGLGLATVFGIVQQHQGWINVYSEPGRGTTFRIYLPRLLKASEKKAVRAVLDSMTGGTETILLVEDDPSLRANVRSVLIRLGYRVLEADHGKAAVEVWNKHREAVRLLLTDLVMPGAMSGIDLGNELLKLNPKLKVIYSSGYSADIASSEFPMEEGVNFLTKPFEVHKLAQTIRQLLDKP